MSTTTGAVFLSYASEDADAAERLAESLRGAGIEVWFDRSELRGGEAWDRQIRKQIHDCALFVPIISANAHARIEGYFRLEWKLAVDRSHLIAPDQTFLLPVVIDGTPQSDERIPDRFREMQWSRLPGGHASPMFIERIRHLLSPEPSRATTVAQRSARAVGDAKPTAQVPLHTRRWRPALLALALAIVAGVGYLAMDRFVLSRSTPAPTAITDKSVAVLPFVDMSEKKDQEYFADGMAEEILNLLSKNPGLRIPARTSSFYFKGKSEDIPNIARRLMVAHVLEGSVRKSGDHVRITAQLVRADNGYHLWSETYDRRLDDIFKVQDEIAAEVVKALKVSLGADEVPRTVPTKNMQTHALILQADFLLARDTYDDVIKAIGYLNQALELDPESAVAWADLSSALTLEWLFGSLPNGQTWQQQREQAVRAAERAIAIDPRLADAHEALAAVRYWFDWDWAAARAELETAQALGSRDFTTSGLLAELRGDLDAALRLWEHASADDPLNFTAYMYRALTYCATGQFNEALPLAEQMVQLAPASSRLHAVLAQVLLALGRSDAALTEAAKETDSGYRAYAIARTYILLGRRAEADAALTEFEKMYAADWAYEIATLHALRGDADQTFSWLDRAYQQHDPALIGVISINVDPDLRRVGKDPRYKAFLRKMNLPE